MPGKKYARGSVEKQQHSPSDEKLHTAHVVKYCDMCVVSVDANMTKERKIIIRINLGYSQCLFDFIFSK